MKKYIQTIIALVIIMSFSMLSMKMPDDLTGLLTLIPAIAGMAWILKIVYDLMESLELYKWKYEKSLQKSKPEKE